MIERGGKKISIGYLQALMEVQRYACPYTKLGFYMPADNVLRKHQTLSRWRESLALYDRFRTPLLVKKTHYLAFKEGNLIYMCYGLRGLFDLCEQDRTKMQDISLCVGESQPRIDQITEKEIQRIRAGLLRKLLKK
jgi:hypothetical protein